MPWPARSSLSATAAAIGSDVCYLMAADSGWRFRALERDAPLFGKLREAVTYANGRWRNLARYARVDCGHVLIDQNSIERCFSPSNESGASQLSVHRPPRGRMALSRAL
jgi:hypothetical protein